jgi:flagellar basal-body rod modification protein FlgD
MAVSSTTQTPTTTPPASTDTTALGRARLADNFSTFLSLLTTQLKNQDPLSPLDSNQFTQQLVQMTGVEQQIASNDLLKKLVANTGSGIQTAVSLIGKDVSAVSGDAQLSNGKADWVYKLKLDAADTKIEVLNAKGAVVHVEAATDNKAGDHAYSWNGKDMNGNKLPDGPYTLRVTAKDSTGTAVTSTTYVQGRVTGVEQLDGVTYITVNGGKISWDTVTSVKEPAATPPATTT